MFLIRARAGRVSGENQQRRVENVSIWHVAAVSDSVIKNFSFSGTVGTNPSRKLDLKLISDTLGTLRPPQNNGYLIVNFR